MGRTRIIASAGGLVIAGTAAAAAVLLLGGSAGSSASGGGKPADTALMQRNIARQLPTGWSNTVTAHNGAVDVWLVHQGDMRSTIVSMRQNKIVNADDPEMLKLLPADAQDGDYLFHISDSQDKGDQVRARVSRRHRGPHPELEFMSRAFIQAQLDMLPTPTPVVVN